MVACLEKSEGNADFHEIVDFLTASFVHYALTVSPTIYASYIEQFWNTAHSQTVNDVKQIHAIVDDKTINFPAQLRIEEQIPITESSSPQNTQSPRQALQEDTQFPQTSVPILNVADQAVFKDSGDRPRCQEAIGGIIAQTRSERVSKHSYDSPLLGGNTPGSDEERIEQDDLTDFIPPTPHDSPLSGGHTPRSDEAKKEGQKIGKEAKSKNSKDEALQDFNFAELDVDNAMENVEGDAETQGRNTAEQITTAGDTVNTAGIDVSVAGPSNVSTAGPSTSTARHIFEDEMMTITDTLVAIRRTSVILC
ncbi:hypothetical protein Tco_1303708 [Tanacetum coccineum]